MTPQVYTVDTTAQIDETYQVMRDRKIRHLPVLEAGVVVGVVSDRDLRAATSTLDPTAQATSAPVSSAMTPNPITTAPRDPVEAAARLMFEHKIGCLPVLEEQALVGILTATDLLSAIVRLTGVEKPGGRLAVRFEESQNLADLTAQVAAQGVRVVSVLTYPFDDAQTDVILRVDTMNTRLLAGLLRVVGYEVLWPPEGKP